MNLGFIKTRNNIMMLLLVIVLLTVSWVAFKYENTLSTDRIKLHRAVSFPQHTPELQENTLVFFGYVGCREICTTRMKEISDIYHQIEKNNNNQKLSVLFINLDPTYPTAVTSAYAKSYNINFKGVTFEQDELTNIIKLFKVNYSTSLFNENEIYHSQFLYFIKLESQKDYFLNHVYTHVPFNKELIAQYIMEMMI